MRRRGALLVAAALMAGAALVAPSSSSAAGRPRTALAWAPMKGIAVDLASANALSDAAAMRQGSILFSTIRDRFHANAVSLNFPFWQHGSRSNDPEVGPMTPSPSRLAMLTLLAERDGLAVQYRPYLYEQNLTNESRPSIQPTNVSVWFAHYWLFLEPYLVSAAESGAASFSVATEFTSLLPYLSKWEQLVVRAKAIYPGPIVYSQQHVPEVTIPGTDRGYDAYQPICPTSPTKTFTTAKACIVTSARQVNVHAFTVGFVHNLQMAGMQSTPRDLTIEELGIPAVAKAYDTPNYFHYTGSPPVDRPVQTDWFAGACDAFYALHLAGIYFWSIDFNSFTPTENDAAKIYPWLGTPTAQAIASCFARPT